MSMTMRRIVSYCSRLRIWSTFASILGRISCIARMSSLLAIALLLIHMIQAAAKVAAMPSNHF